MGWLPKPGAWLPKLIGAIVILLLLCIFLSSYLYKYIPYQQQLLNGRAFRELEQIGNGLHNKTDAYSNAIQSFIKNGSTGNPLFPSFQVSPAYPFDQMDKRTDSFYIGPVQLKEALQSGNWRLEYPIYKCAPGRHPQSKDTNAAGISIPVGSVLQPIITTYKDIFSDYLVLRDRPADTIDRGQTRADNLGNYEIVYSSGTFPVDYRVSLDSLEKGDNSFNLITIHDVIIEGTAYKIFLYPVQLGKERMVLAGLIEQSAYKKGYNGIPFNLATVIGVLVLLLFIHLPILKVYVVGKFERIRGYDIRLIIGTYFITGFLVFFLFSRVFLNHVQAMNNYRNLQTLSDRVEKSLRSEITSACRQLRIWDRTWHDHQNLFVPMLSRDTANVITGKGKISQDTADQRRTDILFHAEVYPYADYVYWIDSVGQSVTFWSSRKTFNNPAILDVKDRSYFQDILHHNLLTIPSANPITDPPDSFTIQPTLSKLDGEYTVNLVIRSQSSPGNNYRAVGFSTEWMYSVCNTQLPPGYNFSIIDVQGNILYDSRPGHALLSNISKETETPSDITAPLRYHSDRYFGSYTLQGRPRALLISPMKGFPYALLVYYDLSGSDDFQGHLIGMAAFFGGAILLLLILSAFVKEWSQPKAMALLSPIDHFDWLHPTPIKHRYYRHLFWSTLSFLVLLFIIWFLIQLRAREFEFSLFFIALLFPFYVALHYFMLREKQRIYASLMRKTSFYPAGDPRILADPFPFPWFRRPLFLFLGTVLIAINLFALLREQHFIVPLLLAQLAFITFLWASLRYFHFRPSATDRRKSWFNYYILAIAMGIFMINIVPACGIFWIVFRQESLVQSNTSAILMAGSIDQRRINVNQRISNYKLAFGRNADPAQRRQDILDLHRLKFEHGIYFTTDDTVTTSASGSGEAAYPISSSYTQIHRWLFHSDSTALVWPANPNYSSDGSWVFRHEADPKWAGPELVYYNQRDAIDNDTIIVKTDATASYSAFQLMLHELSTASPFYKFYYVGCILLILVLLGLLTASLARRIFLLPLVYSRDIPIVKVTDDPQNGPPIDPPEKVSLKTIEQINREEMVLWEDPIHNEIQILAKIAEYYSFYYGVWKSLSDVEKYTLNDFAIDNFTNYKNVGTISGLRAKNILRLEDVTTLLFMTNGFREWILRTRDKDAFDQMAEKIRRTGTWENIKRPLLLLLAIPGVFIFLTQDEVYQKVTGFLTAIAPILSFIQSYFPKKMDKKD